MADHLPGLFGDQHDDLGPLQLAVEERCVGEFGVRRAADKAIRVEIMMERYEKRSKPTQLGHVLVNRRPDHQTSAADFRRRRSAMSFRWSKPVHRHFSRKPAARHHPTRAERRIGRPASSLDPGALDRRAHESSLLVRCSDSSERHLTDQNGPLASRGACIFRPHMRRRPRPFRSPPAH